MGNGNNNFIHFGYCYKLCISFPVALCIVELWYTMTAPHPHRCETCEYNWNSKNWINCPFQKDEEIYYGLKEEVCIPSGTDLFTSIVGCASHSTASNADDVLDELEKWRMSYFDVWVQSDALRDKIAQLRTRTQEQP